MAITIVGTSQAGAAINGDNVTLTFDGTPAENDLVLLVGGSADSNGNNAVGPVTAGYTQAALYQINDGTPITSGVWYKFLTATPDASVEGNGGGVSQEAAAYASIVLRGVDTSTPIDATTVETGPTTSAESNVDAIITATNGAWVVVGVTKADDDTPTAAPSGYSNLATAGQVDTRRFSVAIASKEVATAGTEDPGDFTGWDSAAWYGFTVALRPAGSGSAGSASPGVLALTTTLPAASVSGGAVTAPAVLGLSTTLQAPTVSGGAVSSPAALSLSTTFQAATVSGGAVVSPAALGLSVTVLNTTVVAGGVAVVGTLALSVTLPAPTIGTGGEGSVTPDALALSLGLPAATVSGGAVAEPGVLGLTVSPQNVTVSGGAVVAPEALTATLTIPAASVDGGAVTTPQVLTLDVDLDAVTISGGSVTQPATVALTFTLPAALGFGGDTSATWQEGGISVTVQAGGAGAGGIDGGAATSMQSGGLKAGVQE